MAQAAKIAEAYGYSEINLNVGCPSDRVQSGCFGAVLFKDIYWVAECIAEMQAAVQALGNKTVYVSVGAANQATPPVTAVANLGTVAIVEVPFKLA